MADTSELRVAYASAIDKRLRENLIFIPGITCNNYYEGDAQNAGSVKIPVRAESVAADYDTATGLTATKPTTSYLTVVLDKDLAVNELIDGYTASAVPDDILFERLDSSAYALAVGLQRRGHNELEANSTDFADTTAITKDNVYEYIVDLGEKLSHVFVPKVGRVLLVSTSVYASLLKSPEFIKQSDMGQSIAINANVTRAAGFLIIEDPGLSATTDMIGYNFMWFTEIKAWRYGPVVENGANEYVGASFVKGRTVGQYKLTNSSTSIIKKNA